MKPTLFYSWQSDTDEVCNRYYLRDVIIASLDKLTADMVVEDEIRFDSDTAGVAGTPDIAEQVFFKLRHCECAIFDVTPVSSLGENPGKLLPNPNVLIELGYAAHAIGWDRVICIMNTGFGHSPDALPFDLRGRRFPIRYELKDKASKTKYGFYDLVVAVAIAIRAARDTSHQRAVKALQSLNRDGLTFVEVFGPHPYFSWNTDIHSSVIDRLLVLELLFCNSDAKKGSYAYHWTRLGQLVYEEFRGRPNMGN